MKREVHNQPPAWVERFLRHFLDDELLESVLGDIYEKFRQRSANGNVRSAKIFYALEGLGLLRLFHYRKSKNSITVNPFIMWQNYILIAWRKLRRERIYSTMNVLGLAIGIACILVVFQFIQFELSYDTFHDNHSRIYRVTEEFEDDAQRVHSAMSHSPIAYALSTQVTGIKNMIRIFPQSAFISADKQNKYKENLFCFTDSLFFDTFSFELIEGSAKNALKAPFSVVLTEKMATKYFGTTTNLIGKELFYEDERQSYSYTITGVIKDVPENSHFNFNFIASFSTLDKTIPWYNNWHYPPMYVYMLAEKNNSFLELNNNVQAAIQKHQPDYVKEEKRNFILQPITSIHLHSSLEFEWEANSNYRYLQVFGWMGIFILLIACINFMNMATAQATKRALEIGMRKTLGGLKSQLVGQFISETFVYVLLAFCLAVCMSELTLRFMLHELIEKNLSLFSSFTWTHVLASILFIITVSFIAGFYPALYLAGLKPFQAIKSAKKGFRNKTDLRKGLVTFQFIVSSILISATMIIVSQVRYFQNKNLGFDKEFIVSISLADRYAQQNYTALKNHLLNESSVISAGLSSALPGKGTFHGFDIKPEGWTSNEGISIKTLGTDEDFIKTYGIKILKGRDFSKDIASDQTQAFILNKAAALKLGWADDPTGKDFEMTVYINGPVQHKGKVIGLVEDFNFQSLHNDVEPLVMYINKHPYYAENLSVRIAPGNLDNAVGIIQKNWKAFNPDKPLEYQFLNDNLNQLYQSEMKVTQIFTALTVVAIVISSLGLFALASYTSSKRAKEMSIRKVFGASVNHILSLQVKEYAVIILIANIIVIPGCWYWANQWLDNFAYRISINPLMFVITFLSSLLLAVFTVSFHSLRLARQNPIDTIRHE